MDQEVGGKGVWGDMNAGLSTLCTVGWVPLKVWGVGERKHRPWGDTTQEVC